MVYLLFSTGVCGVPSFHALNVLILQCARVRGIYFILPLFADADLQRRLLIILSFFFREFACHAVLAFPHSVVYLLVFYLRRAAPDFLRCLSYPWRLRPHLVCHGLLQKLPFSTSPPDLYLNFSAQPFPRAQMMSA
jgi:hypothetical protein